MENDVFVALSKKLGIARKDVILKALEFRRMLQVRCSSLAALNLSSTATDVICLEIAANSSSLSIAKATAIQVSGLTQKLYTNAFKAIECILGKQKQISLRDFAVMFGCVSCVSVAEEVLERYKSTQSSAIDFEQPVFAAATLYAVCRSKKVRLDKSKLIAQVNVRRSMFDRVCKQIQPVVEKMTEKSKEKDLKRPYSWLEDSCSKLANDECGNKRTRVTENERKAKEDADYESWKLKILNENGT